MGVYIPAKAWKGQVPFECKDAWTLEGIEAFNKAVRKSIWIPRTQEPDYVVFELKDKNHMSPIGKQGGKQSVQHNKELWTLHHEMGHALSLGHENFHSGWPLRAGLVAQKGKSLHADAYILNETKYTDYGTFDRQSIMLYPNERFGFTANDPKFVYPTLNKALSSGDINLIRLCHPNAPELVPVLRMKGG